MADQNITIEQRIARGIAVLRNAIKEETAVLKPAILAELQDLIRKLDQWRSIRCFVETARLPNATQLYKLASSETGEFDQKRLSNAAHGSFFSVIMGHGIAITGAEEGKADSWWRVLTACRYGLHAAARVTDLQGNQPPTALQYASSAWQHFANLYSQWQDAQQQ